MRTGGPGLRRSADVAVMQATDFGNREDRGGSVGEERLAVIAAMITERPLCAAGISDKSAIASGELPGYISRVGSVFAVHDEIDRCGACGRFTTVFLLARSLPP